MSQVLVGELASIVGERAVLRSPEAMAPHLADWRGRYVGRALCVVMPATTDEVSRIVRVLAHHAVPIVPQGGNTGLCGGATPDSSGQAVVINLSRLNRVRAVDPINDTITVDAGCVLKQVQLAAAEVDRRFPLSIAAEGSCEIGGNLATNAGGVHVLRYGNMRDLTLGIEVVLPDGRVWDGLRGLRKDNSGYDLKQIFIGAEGTLGIITGAVLKLVPRLQTLAVAWAAVTSVQAAVDLLQVVRGHLGERLSAFELIGRAALDLVFKHIPGTRDPLPQVHEWYVLIEVSDSLATAAHGSAMESLLAREIERGAVIDGVVSQSLGQCEALWRLRESISEAQRVEGISIKHDVSVPVSRIPELIQAAGAELAREFGDIRVVPFGHIGDGNIHYNLSRPGAVENAEFIAQTPRANRIVHDIVARLGGSISAEHGLGQLKREEIRLYKTPLELEMMHRVKKALDPQNLMNPGKVL